MKKKTFRIEFKQDGKWYELQGIPMDRMAQAKELEKSTACPTRLCEKCPLDANLYRGVKCWGTMDTHATNVRVLE